MFKRIFLIFLLLGAVASAKDKDKDRFQQVRPVRLDRDGEKWAEKTLKRMTLEQKVGQMIMPLKQADFMNVSSPEFLKLRDLVQKYHLGGITLTVRAEGPFLYKNYPYEAAAWTNALQQASEFPLIFTADFERGLSMRLNGGTVFPHAMAFGAAHDTASAEAFGRITALESRAIGVHWNFFPVSDVNSNPANPIINTRSFGEDPAQVGDLTAAYIRGSHQGGMLATAKHFPGHGDTSTDTHLAMARVDGNAAHLESIELPPFRKAIDAGVDAVMIGHMQIPALETDPNKVATIDPAIVDGLLRQKLGFQGIVVTDALDMNALNRLFVRPGQPDSGRSTVESIKAGADIALQPTSVESAYNALLAAAKSGEIPESRIDASVIKILRAKASVGLDKARFVDLEKVDELVGKPENVAVGQQVANEAITLVRDNGKVLPLRRTSGLAGTPGAGLAYGQVAGVGNRVFALILTDDIRTDYGREFARELRSRVPDVQIMFLDSRVAAAMTEQAMAAAEAAQSVIIAAYVTPSAGKMVNVNGQMVAQLSLDSATAALVKTLLQRDGAKTAVLAMGSPYLAQDFPEVQTYLCAFSNATVSEAGAVKALFGEIPIRGKLPVTIPNIAARGVGIDRAAQVAGGPNASSSGK
jgi:beta-N-acetylhexosaminidase